MAKKVLKYDEAITEIDTIVKRLRSGEISVDILSREVQRATELIAQCRAQLQKAEEEVKSIIEQ
ncbi:MAG: exodeoxyribonuclease VII small subunit [Rikenellaceae bacterium]